MMSMKNVHHLAPLLAKASDWCAITMQLQGDTSGLKVSPVPELRGWGGVGLGWTYENLKTNEITH